MIKVLVELDDDTAARLERVAPSRVRRRSEFIRAALRRALWELEEQATAQAYRRQPDAGRDVYVDSAVWEPAPRATRRKVQR
ncbi:MAG: hypothetical protein A3H97_20480 [Acidobacteria bacterium RIFCSPLOWO2_02_FULL_65_29]|nr:MAG: hypothetical protein A3H97_20480 [Acidobacteria bacterium RIFCSPLOWO2_02_FULL_65_29]